MQVVACVPYTAQVNVLSWPGMIFGAVAIICVTIIIILKVE